MKVADLEVLFTANTTQIDKAEKQVLAVGKKVEQNPVKIGADPKPALDGMGRVEAAAKKLVSERAVVKLDADVTRAESNLKRAVDRLEDLHIRAEGGLDVTADVKRAEASIQRIERQLDGLKKARNAVDVEVNEEPAEAGLKRFLSLFKRKTDEAGSEGGRSLAKGLDAATRGAGQKVGEVVGGDIESTLIDALAAIPIAGGIVLAGVAIGKAITGAIQDGLAVEQNQDRLQALTGISEADALRLARAAGEAYASNFGESIESNMDATRLGLQFRIIDPSATTRDAQLVVQGLAGIADVLGEEVRPTAAAVATMLSTGIATSAKHAYDLIAAGARNGLNRNEDLLDTLTEYPALFQRLGISGDEALGLINQGMRAGARNSDFVADALKELQIRATDASESSAKGYELIGLNAEEMTAKMALGGASAREGLGLILSGLKSIEDPVARNAAGVALVGTKWEDLGDSFLALDLDSAAASLDGVTGSAQRMFDTLAGNDASKIEQAQRNIEVAADGIKGALAVAFAEPLGDFADWVSQNRGPVLQFFSDLVNGAIDFGVTASESFGAFVAGPLADIVEGMKHVIKVMNPFADTSDLEEFINGMRDFETVTDDVSARLESMRKPFNVFADGQIAIANVNDAALRAASSVEAVGYGLDGVTPLVDAFTVSTDGSVRATAEFDAQIRNALMALQEEQAAAQAAGESQQNLTDRWNDGTGALVAQLTQLGLTEEQAWQLVGAYGAVPGSVHTEVTASTWQAQNEIDRFIYLNNGKRLMLYAGLDIEDPAGRYANGAIVEFMASGGIRGGRGLTPMSPIAQMVPPNTWRVVGDRGDVPELFAPLDGSARSWALLMEGFARMPGTPPQMMAQGSITGTPGDPRDRPVTVIQHLTIQSADERLTIRRLNQEAQRAFDASGES